jgi:hypothetical protein
MRIQRDGNDEAKVTGGLGLAWRSKKGKHARHYSLWVLVGPYRWRLKWRR